MKPDKSLQEVWRWKDEVYKEIKSLHGKDLIDYFHQQSKNLQEKYSLHLKHIDPSMARPK